MKGGGGVCVEEAIFLIFTVVTCSNSFNFFFFILFYPPPFVHFTVPITCMTPFSAALSVQLILYSSAQGKVGLIANSFELSEYSHLQSEGPK